MKLNGWQRIGVVVSIFWGIGAPIYVQSSRVSYADRLLVKQIDLCLPAAYNDCIDLALENHSRLIAFNSSAIGDILFVSLVPILVGWLIAYFAIKVFFWVKTGFQSNV